jgi:hypothetical protein
MRVRMGRFLRMGKAHRKMTTRSPGKWVATAPDGTVRDVEPGRSVSLAAGVKIHFGPVDGKVWI